MMLQQEVELQSSFFFLFMRMHHATCGSHLIFAVHLRMRNGRTLKRALFEIHDNLIEETT